MQTNLVMLQIMIESMGYIPICANSANQAAALLEQELPQLILLDIFMPEIDGYEFCEHLKRSPITRDIPVIFMSATDSSENRARGFQLGGVDYIMNPFETLEVSTKVQNYLKFYEVQQELEQMNKRLHSVINSQAKRIEEEQRNILYAIAAVTESVDSNTTHHLDNVSYNCRIIAQGMQFSPEISEEISQNFIDTIEIASKLHDIGKIRTPGEILRKPGKLREDEMKIVKKHVQQGAKILERIYESTQKNEFLPMAIEIARYHHARWDGNGYPLGLCGKKIPLSARIMIIADVYDTLTGERCYKEAYSIEDSVKIIEKESGNFFDPDIVAIFVKIYKQLKND